LSSILRGTTTTPSTSAEDQVSRFDVNARAFDRHVDRNDLAAPFRVERRDAAVENGEFHIAYRADVANKSVGDRADGAALARSGRQQLAPRRDAL
jgi:hypothetical protein